MKRAFWPTLGLVCVLVVLAACGGSQPAAPTAPAPAGQAVAAKPAQKAQAPTAAAEESVAAEPTEPAAEPAEEPAAAPTAADALNLDSRETGLDKLKSYRMSWQAEWNATDAGKTDNANWAWVEEYSSEPKALHWSWKAAGSDAAAKKNALEMWQIGDTTYMLNYDEEGQATCVSMSSEDQSNQLTKGLFSPNTLGSVSNGKYVGSETVNGVKAKHYRYDEKSATLGAFGKVSGDLWVAEDGGFVVKDVMNWQGGEGLLGGSSQTKGDGKWTWELSDVNQPITIKAPENCGGAAEGLPMIQDASEKAQLGDMITYKTGSSLADAVAFYQKEMSAAGWTAEGEPSIMDEFATLQFTREGQKASVTITRDNDKTQVMIAAEKAQ